jgi:hypothetical protein
MENIKSVVVKQFEITGIRTLILTSLECLDSVPP